MKLLVLTKYSRMGASSRLRTYQYYDRIAQKFNTDISNLFPDEYLNNKYNNKGYILLLFRSYVNRFIKLFSLSHYEFIYIEKELFPWVPYIIEKWFLKNKQYILDYDDAIFHKYDKSKNKVIQFILSNKIKKLMANSSAVIVGNEYLKKYAINSGATNVHIVPTAIDINKYTEEKNKSTKKIIGWIGSPTTSEYLKPLVPLLLKLHKENNVSIQIIGSKKQEFIPSEFDIVEWSEETEVSHIKKFTIGIMPLINNDWEKGKCGYKLIQYMGCGVPVIGSPVGVNEKIIDHGKNGYLARNIEDWEKYLKTLLNNQTLRGKFGESARKKVEKEFNKDIEINRIINIMFQLNDNNEVF